MKIRIFGNFEGMNLLAVRNFNNYSDAYLLKATLENEGIFSVIEDEHTTTVYGGVSFSGEVGGIKLLVHEKDAQRVADILKEIELTPLEDEEGNPISCPSCTSLRIKNGYRDYFSEPKGFVGILLAFFFGIFPFFAKPIYKCDTCYHEFPAD